MILVLGGNCSGKSRVAVEAAEEYASRLGLEKVFVATAEARDEIMRNKIKAHRKERDKLGGWRTVEVSSDIHTDMHTDMHEVITASDYPKQVLLVDCVTMWLTRLLSIPSVSFDNLRMEFLSALQQRLAVRDNGGILIVVSNETGLGGISSSHLQNRFANLLGKLNQDLAGLADEVKLVVAGLTVTLK